MDKKLLISAAVAVLVSGPAFAGGKSKEKSAAQTPAPVYGKCMGSNSCKGKSECHTSKHACAGQNSCKGEGWLNTTKEECAKLKGTFEG